jgi:hypothetical protein
MRAARTSALVLIALLIAGATSSAFASPPTGGNTALPCAMTLVGIDAHGSPDPLGAFTVTSNHTDGTPNVGALVVLDFSGCPDVSICSAQVTPGITAQCSPTSHTISGFTNAGGQVTFYVIGGGNGHQPCSAAPCMIVSIDGVVVTDGVNHPIVNVSTTDLNGINGVSAADLSQFFADSFSATYCARSDYDHSVTCAFAVGASDLSRWLTSFFGGYVFDCASLSGQLCP